MAKGIWTIALAAGQGRRLSSVTGGAPKQFWRPTGAGSSLLESTLLRLKPLAIPERTVTVVDASHQAYIEALDRPGLLGTIVFQPVDRGTAAGVLLPLVTVLAEDPDAIVVVTPTDHGVEQPDVFRHGIGQAIERVRSGESDIVLFGVEPTAVTADYGWIAPDVSARRAETFQRVERFVEKPPLVEAFQLFASGAVWNTMVFVASAGALLARYRRHLPLLADVMTQAADLAPGARDAFLREWYPALPRTDFSRDLLTPSRPLCLYTWPSSIGWTDLGTPERLERWLLHAA